MAFFRKRTGAGSRTRADYAKPNTQDNRGAVIFYRYESLKESLTASARTPDEYDAAVRKAAQITGV